MARVEDGSIPNIFFNSTFMQHETMEPNEGSTRRKKDQDWTGVKRKLQFNDDEEEGKCRSNTNEIFNSGRSELLEFRMKKGTVTVYPSIIHLSHFIHHCIYSS